MRRPPGRLRRQLAALLQREFPRLGELPITWSAADVHPTTGWFRTSPMADCWRWEAFARFADKDNSGTVALAVGSYATITECVQVGRLELDPRYGEIEPLTFKSKLREISGEADRHAFSEMLNRELDKKAGRASAIV